MSSKRPAKADRLMVRTPEDFTKIVAAYLKKTGMSATRLSALSTGDIRFVGRALNGDATRMSLPSVDKVLTFIEGNPEGVS